MSGYRELQEAYENNHEVTVLRRKLTRDAVNALRAALLERLGINNQDSEVVVMKARNGGILLSELATLEIGDVLQARGEIAIKGISAAPQTSFMLDINFSYRQDRVLIEVSGMDPQVINEAMDFHHLADSIFERLLLKLSTY
ncbi:hypothetical protein ACF8GG_19810 [Pseudomonas sp. yb_1]|uniref:hypothetical protein n=1 Tax=Pseudomonas sp. yb_1 TaxID=3367217 RepID=UPI00370C2C23